jgi:MFS transporter, OFA family, oxalate/formate antiporter
MSSSQETPNKGWIVTAAGLGINLILGALYAWSVMGKALVVQWKWSKFDAALPFAISTAAFAISMVFAGRLQDKIGPKKVAALGGLVFGTGLIASSWATTPLGMLLTFGVIGGAGIGLGYCATTPRPSSGSRQRRKVSSPASWSVV